MSFYDQFEAAINRRNARLLNLLAWIVVARGHFKNYELADRIKAIVAKHGSSVRVGNGWAECDNWCLGRLPLRAEQR